MHITYDARYRSAYVRLSNRRVVTTRPLSDVVLVDLDADANVIGVELLDVDAPSVEDITGARRPMSRAALEE